MKNITQKIRNLVMSPSCSITKANLLDIFANRSRMNFKDTDSSENPDISKGEFKDFPGFFFFLIFSKTEKVISVFTQKSQVSRLCAPIVLAANLD